MAIVFVCLSVCLPMHLPTPNDRADNISIVTPTKVKATYVIIILVRDPHLWLEHVTAHLLLVHLVFLCMFLPSHSPLQSSFIRFYLFCSSLPAFFYPPLPLQSSFYPFYLLRSSLSASLHPSLLLILPFSPWQTQRTQPHFLIYLWLKIDVCGLAVTSPFH